MVESDSVVGESVSDVTTELSKGTKEGMDDIRHDVCRRYKYVSNLVG